MNRKIYIAHSLKLICKLIDTEHTIFKWQAVLL